MLRQKATFPLAPGQYKDLKKRMLQWAQPFSILLFLDNNNYTSPYGRYECLLACGASHAHICTEAEFSSLQALSKENDWLFGHIAYDFKNRIEKNISSRNPSKTGFPLFYFFCPETVCYLDKDKTTFTIESFNDDPSNIFNAILNTIVPGKTELPKLNFTRRIDRADYLQIISRLRKHIADGDCYEINLCNEGYCTDAAVDPLSAFHALNALSPAPFAAYYRNHDKYMLCASPERYLQKKGSKIIAQPIKGTARRDADATKDAEIIAALKNDPKERAENVMIVDLMRNDLARCCEVGSVAVDELFSVYSFPQVHQMISTVSGTIKKDIPFTDAVQLSFPMGSMTGAPKIKVMQLIDQYERSRRELFSGTVGYITPSGDFDFNVVIRSVFYNAESRYLSYQTGGAITYDSDPEKEWDEMQLKAWALERIFS